MAQYTIGSTYYTTEYYHLGLKTSRTSTLCIKSISKIEMLEQEALWQKEKKEEIELKNAELNTFVYKVSHDLRDSVSSLLRLDEIVKLGAKDNKSLHYFDLYHSQIQQLHGILMNLISLTQIKEKKIEPVLLDFQPMVDECIEAHQFILTVQRNQAIKQCDNYQKRENICSIESR